MPSPPQDFRDYLDIDGAELRLTVERTELARAGEEHFTTFSIDAMVALTVQVQSWLTSRVVRACTDRGRVIAAMRVTAALDVAGRTDRLAFDWAYDWQPDPQWTRQWIPSGKVENKPFSPQAIVAVTDGVIQWLSTRLVRPENEPPPQEITLILGAEPAEDNAADGTVMPEPPLPGDMPPEARGS